MPPVSQQGSRTSLISAIVVLTILFLVALVFAVWFGVDRGRVTRDYSEFQRKYIPDVIGEGTLTGPTVPQLTAARNSLPAYRSLPLIEVAKRQGDDLARLITGQSDAKPIDAIAVATQALGDAANVGVAPTPTENLAGALRAAVAKINSDKNQMADLQNQIKTEQAQKTQLIADNGAALAAKDQAVAKAVADAQRAVQQLQEYQDSKNQSIKQMEDSRASERQTAQQAVASRDEQLATLQRNLSLANNELDALRNKLGQRRLDPAAPVIRHADGTIVRVGGGGIVYIGLGAGDQISPGLTFEVYDRLDGIPASAANEDDTDLPEGKASIEVIRVGATSSECRVIHQQPNTTLAEGDPIANLVYDPNTKYNFVVYGKFDITHKGAATSQDADIIKRLITQWGGQVADQVNVNTDFVVLGEEPQVPQYTSEELSDPINQQRRVAAERDQQAYRTIRNAAVELHIPILNQNRFLYLVGYYDQAGH